MSIQHPSELAYGYPDLPSSFEKAVLLVDKAIDRTSFDVVEDVRELTGQKVGHAGTLDPKATGLLIMLIGRATKLMESFMELPKAYEGRLRLGEITPSYDTETDVVERKDASHITDAMIEEARTEFLGTITQLPPMHSAVKVGGEPLYKKARRGESTDRPPRQVTIKDFEITERDGPDVSFAVTCSKGTYIRTLAYDLGQELEVGAHLIGLRRTAIGPYQVGDAWTVSQLEDALT